MPDDSSERIEVAVLRPTKNYLDRQVERGVSYANSVNQAILTMAKLRAVIGEGGQIEIRRADGRTEKLEFPH